VNKKLRVPFFCLALLSIGIMPVAATMPKDFSEGTDLDPSETKSAIAQQTLSPLAINRELEEDRPLVAIAKQTPPEPQILDKSQLRTGKFQGKILVDSENQKLNSDWALEISDVENPKVENSEVEHPEAALAAETPLPTTEIPRLNEIERPKTRVNDLFQRSTPTFTGRDRPVQISQSLVQVSGVQLNPTATGLEVILETKEGQILQAVTRTDGNSLIAEISNAQLVLPEGSEFRAENPNQGISLVTVTQLDANRIEVRVTGETAVPSGQVVNSDRGLVFSLIPADPQEISIVVTATRTEETTLNVSRSVTVINREQIQEQAATARDLQDILGKSVPGLTPPREQQYGPTLRGRPPLILIDGVPMSGNFTTGFIRDWRTIDPSAVERIEVVRGPSAIYGDGATGGVINIITRRATQRFTATSQVGVNASLTHPSDSFGYNLQQSIAGREGNFDYLASFGLSTTGDFFDARGDRIPLFDSGASNSRSINILGKVGVDLTEEQRLQVTFNHFYDPQNYSFISDPIVDTLPGRQKARALEVGRLRFIDTSGPGNVSSAATLNYTNQNLFGSQLGFQAYYRSTESREAFFDVRAFEPENEFPLLRSVQMSERFGGRLQIETPLFETASLLWGADYSSEDISETNDYFDKEEFDNNGSRVLKKIRDRTVSPVFNIESLGLFAQAQWNISNRLILSGGLRHDRFRVTVPTYINADDNNIGGGSRNLNGTVFNGGVVFKVTPDFSLFTNFSQGFSVPDIARLLRRPPDNFDFGNDLELTEPIKVNNYEIGIRGEWQSVQGSLSVFYSKSELGGSVVFDDPTKSGRLVRAPRRDYGIEAAIDWQPSEGWQLGGTVSYTEGEEKLDPNGKYLAISSFDISPLKLTAYVEHQTTSSWGNRLQVLYVGDRDRAFNDGVESIPIESYLVVDYISTLKLGPGTLIVGIENLLNNQYSTATSQYIGGFADSSNFTARGRTISVNYRFTW
jgi:iron complex outermembrane receptor protein